MIDPVIDALDIDALLGAIAGRLNAIVPVGVHVTAEGGMVWFGGSGSYAADTSEIFRDEPADPSFSKIDRKLKSRPTTLDEAIAAVAFRGRSARFE
jgi:hypothetical protein